MKDYILKDSKGSASGEHAWTFDLGHPLRLDRGFLRSREREKVAQPDEGRQGKTIRGEVSNPGRQKTSVRRGNEFLHKTSLLIPAALAEIKTARARFE